MNKDMVKDVLLLPLIAVIIVACGALFFGTFVAAIVGFIWLCANMWPVAAIIGWLVVGFILHRVTVAHEQAQARAMAALMEYSEQFDQEQKGNENAERV